VHFLQRKTPALDDIAFALITKALRSPAKLGAGSQERGNFWFDVDRKASGAMNK